MNVLVLGLLDSSKDRCFRHSFAIHFITVFVSLNSNITSFTIYANIASAPKKAAHETKTLPLITSAALSNPRFPLVFDEVELVAGALELDVLLLLVVGNVDVKATPALAELVFVAVEFTALDVVALLAVVVALALVVVALEPPNCAGVPTIVKIPLLVLRL